MALQVWLPLNGNLNNNGIGNITVSGSPTFNDAGKIGKCLSSQVNFTTFPWMTFRPENNFSLAIWAKGNVTSSTTYIIACTAFELRVSTSYIKVGWGGSANEPAVWSATVDTNTWYHICFTWEGTTKLLKLYINGDLKATSNVVGNVPTSIAATANLPYNGSRYLNDFRIYNHCLSPKEVKEISKGLVLHYKFDDPYMENTTNLASDVASYNYTAKEVATYATAIKGKTQYPNAILTYSLYIKNTSAHPLAARISPYNAADTDYSAFYGETIPAGSEGLSTVTVDLTDTSLWNGKAVLYVQNRNSGTIPEQKIFYVKEVQLEQKNHRTPFTPNSRSGVICFDSSGYNYYSNISAQNALTLSTNSARYSHATHFGSFQQPHTGIANPTPLLTNLTDCTISWWQNNDGTGNSLPFTGQDTSHYICAGSTTTRLYDYAIGANAWLYKNGVKETNRSVSGSNIYHGGIFYTQGTWSHFCLNHVDFSSWTRLYINAYSSGWPLNAYISDVRIYATALSDADIKELYETSQVVDSKGNLYGYELKEE